MKKYKMIMTDKKKDWHGKTVYRIQALRSFGDVKAGDLGGYVANGQNLSHYGNCWIAENAVVTKDARVIENAIISGNATISYRAIISGNARVYGNALVMGDPYIFEDYPKITGDACVFGNAKIWHNAIISEKAKVFGNADISTCTIKGNANVFGKAKIDHYAEIAGNTRIFGNSIVLHCKVIGDSIICGNTKIMLRCDGYFSAYPNIIDSVIFNNANIFGECTVKKSYISDEITTAVCVIENCIIGNKTNRINSSVSYNLLEKYGINKNLYIPCTA